MLSFPLKIYNKELTVTVPEPENALKGGEIILPRSTSAFVKSGMAVWNTTSSDELRMEACNVLHSSYITKASSSNINTAPSVCGNKQSNYFPRVEHAFRDEGTSSSERLNC